MIVRRTLPCLLAALLGVGAALVTACGSGSDSGIPSANASGLKSQINDVSQAVEDGRCSDVPGQLRQVDEGIDDLPPSTDDQLVTNLRDGADTLRTLAAEECDATPTETTPTETTPTATIPTDTLPTETETVPPETTTTEPPVETIPPETTPVPTPDPTPEPEPDPVPPPPTGTPGGGVEPQIP